MSDTEPETMTLTEGLAQVKLLTKRLTSTLGESIFISAGRGLDDKTIHDIPREDMKKRCRSDFDKCRALISRRTAIKQGIVDANAREMVVIGNKTYTIAAAIEKKKSIENEKALLSAMVNQLEVARAKVGTKNEVVERNLQTLLEHLGEGEDSEAPDITTVTQRYRDNNEFRLVDPINLSEQIAALSKEVDEFEADVDTALSIKNATVTITVG